MGQYSKALSYGEKALEIAGNILPSNHSDLAQYYVNMGVIYNKVGKNSKALACYERAQEIYQNTLSPNHSNLNQVRKCIQSLKQML
jgi:tetratricopeptide (TPR) repeat protein